MYSIKMRASKKKKDCEIPDHISGAERLTTLNNLELLITQLFHRALNHPLGEPDFINLSINKIDSHEIIHLTSLPIETVCVKTAVEGMSIVHRVLEDIGLDQHSIEQSFQWLRSGGAPNGGGNMRGAILFDALTKRRLEEDQYAGIRATNMDMTAEAELQLNKMLSAQNSYNPKTRDALVLATKVCSYPGVIAELCSSDDPDYTGGYIACKKFGYIRINRIKPPGCKLGSRVIFINSNDCDIASYKNYLRNSVVLINEIGTVNRVYEYKNFNSYLQKL